MGGDSVGLCRKFDVGGNTNVGGEANLFLVLPHGVGFAQKLLKSRPMKFTPVNPANICFRDSVARPQCLFKEFQALIAVVLSG